MSNSSEFIINKVNIPSLPTVAYPSIRNVIEVPSVKVLNTTAKVPTLSLKTPVKTLEPLTIPTSYPRVVGIRVPAPLSGSHITDTIDSIADAARVPIAAALGDDWAIQTIRNSIADDPDSYLHKISSDNKFSNLYNYVNKLGAVHKAAMDAHVSNNYKNTDNRTRSFINELETLDILANPVKGIFNEHDGMITGFLRGLAGKKKYNWDTGNTAVDLGLEIVADPANYVPIIGQGAAVSKAKVAAPTLVKAGYQGAINSLDDAAKAALKSNADDIAEAALKNSADNLADNLLKTHRPQKLLSATKLSEKETFDNLARMIQRTVKGSDFDVIRKSLVEAAQQSGSFAQIGKLKSIIAASDAVDSWIVRVSLAPMTGGLTLVPKSAWRKAYSFAQQKRLVRLGSKIINRVELPFEQEARYILRGEEFVVEHTKDSAQRTGRLSATLKTNITSIDEQMKNIRMKAANDPTREYMFESAANLVDELGMDKALEEVINRRDIVTFTFTAEGDSIKLIPLKIYNKADLQDAVRTGAYIVHKSDYLNVLKAAKETKEINPLIESWKLYINKFKGTALSRYGTVVRNAVDATIKATLHTVNDLVDVIIYGFDGIRSINEYTEVVNILLDKVAAHPKYLKQALNDTRQIDIGKLLDAIKDNPFDDLSKYFTQEDLAKYTALNCKNLDELDVVIRAWSDFMIYGVGAPGEISSKAAKLYNDYRAVNEILYGADGAGYKLINEMQDVLAADLNYAEHFKNEIIHNINLKIKSYDTRIAEIEDVITKMKDAGADKRAIQHQYRTLAELKKQRKAQTKLLQLGEEHSSKLIRKFGTPIDIRSTLDSDLFKDPKVAHATHKEWNFENWESLFTHEDIMRYDSAEYANMLKNSTALEDEIPKLKFLIYKDLDYLSKSINFTISDIVNYRYLMSDEGIDLFKKLDPELQDLVKRRLLQDKNLAEQVQSIYDQLDELLAKLPANNISYRRDIEAIEEIKIRLGKLLTSRDDIEDYLLDKDLINPNNIRQTTAIGTLISDETGTIRAYNDPRKVAENKLKSLQEVYTQTIQFRYLNQLLKDSPEEFERRVRELSVNNYYTDFVNKIDYETIPQRITQLNEQLLTVLNKVNIHPEDLGPDYQYIINKLLKNEALTQEELDTYVNYFLKKGLRQRRYVNNSAVETLLNVGLRENWNKLKEAKKAHHEKTELARKKAEEYWQLYKDTQRKDIEKDYEYSKKKKQRFRQEITEQLDTELKQVKEVQEKFYQENKSLIDWYIQQNKEVTISYERYVLPTVVEPITDTPANIIRKLEQGKKEISEALDPSGENLLEIIPISDNMSNAQKHDLHIRRKSIDYNIKRLNKQINSLKKLPQDEVITRDIEFFIVDDIDISDTEIRSFSFNTKNSSSVRNKHNQYIEKVIKDYLKNIKGFTTDEQGYNIVLDEILNSSMTQKQQRHMRAVFDEGYISKLSQYKDNPDTLKKHLTSAYKKLFSEFERTQKIKFIAELKEEIITNKAFKGSSSYLNKIDKLTSAQQDKLKKYIYKRMENYNDERNSIFRKNIFEEYIQNAEKQFQEFGIFDIGRIKKNPRIADPEEYLSDYAELLQESMNRIPYSTEYTNESYYKYFQRYNKSKQIYREYSKLKEATRHANIKKKLYTNAIMEANMIPTDNVDEYLERASENKYAKYIYYYIKTDADKEYLAELLKSRDYHWHRAKLINAELAFQRDQIKWAAYMKDRIRILEVAQEHTAIYNLYKQLKYSDDPRAFTEYLPPKKLNAAGQAAKEAGQPITSDMYEPDMDWDRASLNEYVMQQLDKESTEFLKTHTAADAANAFYMSPELRHAGSRLSLINNINYRMQNDPDLIADIAQAKAMRTNPLYNKNFIEEATNISQQPFTVNNETYKSLQDFKYKGTSIETYVTPEEYESFKQAKNMYDRVINKEQAINEIRRQGNKTLEDIITNRNEEFLIGFAQTGVYKVLAQSEDGLKILKKLCIDAPGIEEDLVERLIKAFNGDTSLAVADDIYNICYKYAMDLGLTRKQYDNLWENYKTKVHLHWYSDPTDVHPVYFLDSIKEFKDKHKTVFNITEEYRAKDISLEKILESHEATRAFSKYHPLRMFEKVEHFARSAQYKKLVDLGFSRGTALAEVINSQFDYTAKPELIAKLELLFPFLTFPIENLKFWVRQIDENPAYILAVLRLREANYKMYDRSDYELENNTGLMYNYNAGNILLGSPKPGKSNLVFKLNNSLFDALNMVAHPIQSMMDKSIIPVGSNKNPMNMIPGYSNVSTIMTGLKDIPRKGLTPSTLWRSLFGDVYNYRTFTPYEQREGYWYDKNTGTWKRIYNKGYSKRVNYRRIYPRTIYYKRIYEKRNYVQPVIKSKITQDLNNFKNGLRYKLRKPSYDLIYRKVWR